MLPGWRPHSALALSGCLVLCGAAASAQSQCRLKACRMVIGKVILYGRCFRRRQMDAVFTSTYRDWKIAARNSRAHSRDLLADIQTMASAFIGRY